MPEAATYGWDTVYATRLDDANAAIAAAKAWPPTFQVALSNESLQGAFGTWAIEGGAGTDVRLAIPLPEMTFVKGGTSRNVAGATTRFNVRLAYVPGDPVDDVTPHALQVDGQAAAAAAADSTLVLEVAGGTFDDGQSVDLLSRAGMERCLKAWVGANLDTFDHVFATVDVAERAADGAFGWMVPTYVDYAVSGDGTDAEPLLAVLCQTGGRPSDGLTPALSPSAVPTGDRAGFMIATARFLDQLVRPSLGFAFPGLQASDVAVAHDQLGLALVNPVWLIPASSMDTPPQLVDLTLRVLDDVLSLTSETKVEIVTDIFAHCRQTRGYTFTIGTNGQGEQTLVAVADAASTSEPLHWTEKDDQNIAVGEEILDAVAGLIAMALAVLTDGVGLIVVAAILGLLTGFAPAERGIMKAYKQDDAPSLDFLALNATRPIAWPASSGFKLGSVGLNGSFQLGGDPRPTI